MDPISSVVSGRSTPTPNPVPAQQREGEEAINAPQRPSDSFTPSTPGQDVQLQRRQVVEDISRNQKVTEQLRSGSEQLNAAQDLARQASDPALDEESRQQLNQQFEQVRDGLNALADRVERGEKSSERASRLRVESGIASADEARETTRTLESSLGQLNQEVATLTQQGEALGADFPRTAQRANVEPPASSQDASRQATQIRQSISEQPQAAVASQANIDRQTALTLFQ